jgi:CO/xanthine dehydrogenase Mo-binding subunit
MATATMAGVSGGQIGRDLPRLEGREKVTGRAEYTHNLRLPGMLHGKVFRSTVAHGRIKSIDTGAAKAVPGVYRVVTSEDVIKVIPHPYYGPAFHDQPILAIGKVHYVGEPVAVVLAEDPHVADAAAALIVAEYEELPAVYDEVEAAQNEIVVHDELKPAGTFADLKHLKGARSRSCRSRISGAIGSRSIRHRRGRPSCASRSPGCSAGRRTACASRCRIWAAAMAASSTSSSRRW